MALGLRISNDGDCSELEILIDPMAHGWTGVATGAFDPGYLYSYMLLGRLQDLGNMRFDGMA